MKIKFILLIVGLAFISGACGEDDPEEVVRYKLIVNNTTATNVDIFLNTDLTTDGFVSEGTVVAGGTREINNLVIEANYTLRASVQGESVDDFFDEQTFSNSTAADLEIDVTD